MTRTLTSRFLLLACIVAYSSLALAAPIPIVEFTFDGNLTNTGSAGGAGTFVSGNGATPVLAADAGTQGVGDTAMDNTSANGMGNAVTTGATGGWMDISDGSGGLNNALDGLQSFTLTAWVKSSVAPGNVARLVTKRHSSSSTSFGTWFSNGRLALQVNGSSTGSPLAAWTTLDTWQFVAVAYDGTSTADNVRFYSGTADSMVLSSAGVTTLANGTLASNTHALRIGNLTSGTAQRPFDGLIDDVRIFGSTADATGALSEADIYAVFLNDHPIPEPGGAMLLLCAVACGLLVRWRRAG